MGIEREGGRRKDTKPFSGRVGEGKRENNYPEEGWWRREENYLVSYVTL